MDQLDHARLDYTFRAACQGKPDTSNLNSTILGLTTFGDRTGLLKPHRLAQYGGQLLVESGNFRYDREIWNGKGAQARYDTRTDLGNTPEVDGDGKLYAGRTAIQITGKANYASFRDWARTLDPRAPDFVASPELVNTDPWEGLGPIWYWTTRNINAMADDGDTKAITRRINGGFNHLKEREQATVRMSLVLLGYKATDVKPFQADAKLMVDGDAGTNTRKALHLALVKLSK